MIFRDMKIEIPEDMIVPENNRDTTNPRNRRWLLRNLGIRNSTHPKFKEIMEKLKKEEM